MKISLFSVLGCVGLVFFAAGTGLAKAAESGNAERGRALTETCVACHGQDGNSAITDYPKLAGQSVTYLLRMLRAIQEGNSPAPLMAGQLDDKSEQDLRDIAAFYHAQKPSTGAAQDKNLALGEKIYRWGIPKRGVAACGSCHSPTGLGNAPAGYPRLAGQHAAYVGKRLLKLRDGVGVYDETSSIMRDIAQGLSAGDIEAVANYIQGLRVNQ